MKEKLRYVWLLLSWLLFGAAAHGQVYDSVFYPTDSSAVLYFHNHLDVYSPLMTKYNDSSLVDFEEYDPLQQRYDFFATQGNVGMAYRPLDYAPRQHTGFDYGIYSFDAYLVDQPEVKYYLNAKPYSEIGYVTGAKKEQLFRVRHQQRVFKRVALGVDFGLINSLGSYQRQKTDDIKLVVNGQYFTSDLRYGLVINYNLARATVRENGGIRFDSIYEQNLETNRSIIDIKLNDAENKVRRSGVYLQQYFQLSGKKRSTMPTDSLERQKPRIQIKFGRLSHSFNYTSSSHLYTDKKPDLIYYPNTYYDSINTYDSVWFRKVENTFSWSTADYLDRLKPQPFLLMFGIRHQLATVRDSVLTSEYQNLMPYGEIYIRPFPFVSLRGEASYVLTGTGYQGDYRVYGQATIDILRRKPYRTLFNFALELSNNEVPYFFNHYFSNHFRWDNKYGKSSTNKLQAWVVQRNTRLGVDVINRNDYVYLAADTLPAQISGSVEVFKAYLQQSLVLGKFDLGGRVVYQKVSRPEVLRLPELMAAFTLTFNLPMFKGALVTRSGFDVYYFTKYYADAWMPALRSFYLQNEKEVGGYVHADFFIDFQVKRTRFFMKFQNLLSVVGENSYYQIPHYPLQDLSFKFGLSWRFHD
ncbi:MAG TPA: putative porin [Bacteroidales bacterium]|nr:putative porin [Bacteroidales bacterium]